MNVLVTGADGQLGRTFRKMTDGLDWNIIYTDISELDITDADAVMDVVCAGNIGLILNFAAYTDVAKAEKEEEMARRVNALAPANLARAAKAADAFLVHISTDYVFDGSKSVPYGEDDIARPLNAYGRTKLEGDMAVQKSGCRHMIIRTSWLYSEFGRNFVKTIFEKTASTPVIDVVCDQTGSPTYAGDLVGFILDVIGSDMPEHTGLYNFSNEGVCSWYDLALEVCNISGHLCEVRPCLTSGYPSGVVRPSFSVLDKSRVKNTFGVAIPHWKDSLRYCMGCFDLQ